LLCRNPSKKREGEWSLGTSTRVRPLRGVHQIKKTKRGGRGKKKPLPWGKSRQRTGNLPIWKRIKKNEEKAVGGRKCVSTLIQGGLRREGKIWGGKRPLFWGKRVFPGTLERAFELLEKKKTIHLRLVKQGDSILKQRKGLIAAGERGTVLSCLPEKVQKGRKSQRIKKKVAVKTAKKRGKPILRGENTKPGQKAGGGGGSGKKEARSSEGKKKKKRKNPGPSYPRLVEGK